MRTITRQALLGLMALVCLVSLAAWSRLAGLADSPAIGLHGWWQATASRYDGDRSVEFAIDRAGFFVKRNAYPFSGPGPAERQGWHVSASEPLMFFSCGLGMDTLKLDTNLDRLGFQLASGHWTSWQGAPPRPYLAAQVPHWAVATSSGSMPLWAAVAFVRRRNRYAPGACRHCGYDLRATPDRCPECGRATDVSAGAVAATLA